MISIDEAVRLFADVSVKRGWLEPDKWGELPSAADFFYNIFTPTHPRGSVFSWNSWPMKRLEHLADNWRGVFWFLLIYFADKSSPETLSPRRSNLNSNWVHLHRDLAFHSGQAALQTPLEYTFA